MTKKAILFTLIFNSIILIGVPAAHGYGIMILFECISIPNLINQGFSFQKEYHLESSLILIGLLSLIGKLISISVLFSKNILKKKHWIYIAFTLMLIPFIMVCYSAYIYDEFLFLITFGSGIPFLMCFGRVLYLINN